jgi:hypothetical protein
MTQGQFNRRMANCEWRHLFNSARTRQCQEGVLDDYFDRTSQGNTLGKGAQSLMVINHGAPTESNGNNLALRAGIIIAAIAVLYWFVFKGK